MVDKMCFIRSALDTGVEQELGPFKSSWPGSGDWFLSTAHCDGATFAFRAGSSSLMNYREIYCSVETKLAGPRANIRSEQAGVNIYVL